MDQNGYNGNLTRDYNFTHIEKIQNVNSIEKRNHICMVEVVRLELKTPELKIL